MVLGFARSLFHDNEQNPGACPRYRGFVLLEIFSKTWEGG